MLSCLWNRWPYGLLVLIALIVHGPMLFIDGVFWDGWMMYLWLQTEDWLSLREFYLQVGRPGDVLLNEAMGYFPNFIFAYHVIAWITIVIPACVIYKISRAQNWFSKHASTTLALIALCFPGNQVAFDPCIMMNSFWVALFFVACLLAFSAAERSGIWHFAWRLAAQLCFFASFTLASLLSFYFGFLTLFILHFRNVQQLTWKQVFTQMAKRHLDYCLLPFVFWILKETCFPRHGLFINYNRISVDFSTYVVPVWGFVWYGVLLQFHESSMLILGNMFSRHPLLLLTIVLGLGGFYRFARIGTYPFFMGATRNWQVLGFAAWLFALAIIPYVVIGKYPALRGPDSRHSILLSLPVALLVTAVLGLVARKAGGGLSRDGWFVIVGLLLTFGVTYVKNYVHFQAQAVASRAILVQLSAAPHGKQYSIFWVQDKSTHDGYHLHEWSSIFRLAWHQEAWMAVDTRKEGNANSWDMSDARKRLWNLSDFNPHGAQANLILEAGPAARCDLAPWHRDREMAWHYLYYRLFAPAELDSWLAQVVTIKFEPTQAPKHIYWKFLGLPHPLSSGSAPARLSCWPL